MSRQTLIVIVIVALAAAGYLVYSTLVPKEAIEPQKVPEQSITKKQDHIAPPPSELAKSLAESQKLPPEQQKMSDLLQPKPTDIVLGDPSAPVTMVEYASLSCSHCGEFHRKEMPAIEARLIKTGKAKLVYRDFPLNAPALAAAKMVQCLAKNRVEQALHTLYNTQKNWAYDKNYMKNLEQAGLLLGMPPSRFEQCMKNKPIEQYILQERVNAMNIAGVKGTPTMFVNGQKVEGKLTADKIVKLVNAATGPRR